MYIYPDNLKAKPKLWLWELKDIVVIGIGLLFSVLALTNGAGMFLLARMCCASIRSMSWKTCAMRLADASST